MRYEQLCAEAESAYCGSPGAGESDGPGGVQLGVAGYEHRVALRNSGRIDPRDLNGYIAVCGGYSGLARALELDPEAVIEELGKSGLRGRGGAGYPAAQKWQACREAGIACHESEAGERYAVCNAVDADPCAKTARLLLGSDPHSVLEGLLIGAYAVGAERCFVCMNAGYRDEVMLVREVVEQMRQFGLVGEDILESGFSCDIVVEEVAGSLVAGEETALICVLEGKQPLPYLRLSYPAAKGLHGRPTLVNSAETLANVSAIFQRHPAVQYRDGAGGSGGTKVVTVCGDVNRPCTVEVPFGTTVRALIEETQGGSLSDLNIKAAQFGGPTGAFFAGSLLDTPIAFEDVKAAGSVMGSGTIRVIGGGSCAVEMARDAMSYLRDQSCGKCSACREGAYQITDMLADIAEGRGKTEDMELLLELGESMKTGSICGLGKDGYKPLLSSIELFADDYSAHIDGKRCPAKE